MKPWHEITHYAGFDWAKDHHDIVIVNREGQIVADFRIEHSAVGWKQWQARIEPYPGLAVCIETSQGAAIEKLVESGCSIYPINPKNARNYRERKISSGNKTDRLDAWSCADALRVDGHGWRALSPQDPLIQELRILCRDEMALIEERTALVNQLQQALHEYYPVALAAFSDWGLHSSWAFVETFPTPESLAKAGKRKWEKFLHVNKLYNEQTYAKRMELFSQATEFCVGAPVTRAKSKLAHTRVKQLRVLEIQLAEYRKEIERLFAQHPDHTMFGSLPGAGSKLAPRLLSEIGSDRTLFEDPQSLQCLAGTAPVCKQSGKMRQVHMRFSCNKILRCTIHLLSDLSRKQCPWAQIYYKTLRERGQTHARALRCLGQRWIKILWKMWQTRTCYDAELHARNQLAHGSWILQIKPN